MAENFFSQSAEAARMRSRSLSYMREFNLSGPSVGVKKMLAVAPFPCLNQNADVFIRIMVGNPLFNFVFGMGVFDRDGIIESEISYKTQKPSVTRTTTPTNLLMPEEILHVGNADELFVEMIAEQRIGTEETYMMECDRGEIIENENELKQEPIEIPESIDNEELMLGIEGIEKNYEEYEILESLNELIAGEIIVDDRGINTNVNKNGNTQIEFGENFSNNASSENEPRVPENNVENLDMMDYNNVVHYYVNHIIDGIDNEDETYSNEDYFGGSETYCEDVDIFDVNNEKYDDYGDDGDDDEIETENENGGDADADNDNDNDNDSEQYGEEEDEFGDDYNANYNNDGDDDDDDGTNDDTNESLNENELFWNDDIEYDAYHQYLSDINDNDDDENIDDQSEPFDHEVGSSENDYEALALAIANLNISGRSSAIPNADSNVNVSAGGVVGVATEKNDEDEVYYGSIDNAVNDEVEWHMNNTNQSSFYSLSYEEASNYEEWIENEDSVIDLTVDDDDDNDNDDNDSGQHHNNHHNYQQEENELNIMDFCNESDLELVYFNRGAEVSSVNFMQSNNNTNTRLNNQQYRDGMTIEEVAKFLH